MAAHDSVIPVPGILTPFLASVSTRHIHMVHTHTCRQNTHTTKHKINKSKNNFFFFIKIQVILGVGEMAQLLLSLMT